MSLNYKACFRLRSREFRAAEFKSLSSDLGAQFGGSTASFIVDENLNLDETSSYVIPKDRYDQYQELLHHSTNSLIANFSHEKFCYSVGYIDVGESRHALLVISDRSLERMADHLEDRQSSILDYFVRAYSALDSKAMVLGLDCEFSSLVSFLDMNLAPQAIEQEVRAGIELNSALADSLCNLGAKRVQVGGLDVTTRWFPGIDDLFDDD